MQYDESYARKLINQVHWTWAKTYVSLPHEYIVRGRCGLADQEFEYLVHAQREYGIPEQWHKYNFPYLYIDGYKYWTMGDAIENTTIINRQKVFSEFDSIGIFEERVINNGKDLTRSDYELLSDDFYWTFSRYNEQVIYEVGCGSGLTYEYFQIDPKKYWGVDPSKKAIEKFKSSHPELKDRLFCNSFEESVNYWTKGNNIVLATFGAASFFMKPYLKILADSGQDFFLMFYKEGYCPESFKDMHHFNYTDSELKEIFPKGFHYSNLAKNNRIVISRKYVLAEVCGEWHGPEKPTQQE